MVIFPSASILALDMAYGRATLEHSERRVFALGTGTPPVFNATPVDPTSGDSGVSIRFRVIVYDMDGDTLNVTWDWGDGLNDTDLTLPANIARTVVHYHTYNPIPLPGQEGTVSYTLNVSLDDGNGNIVWDLTAVNIKLPFNGRPALLNMSMIPSGTKTRVNPGDEVTIVANGSDVEGEPLTWTFVFNNSVEDYLVVVNHTDWSAPGEVVRCNVTHVFPAVGSYVVTLNLTDTTPPYDHYPHNVSESLGIEVVANAKPGSGGYIMVEPGDPLVRSETGYVLVNYSVKAQDDDGEVLTATWDFGDGSPPVSESSPGGSSLLYGFIQQRNYTDAGNFTVSVTITDGVAGHEILLLTVVQVNSSNLPPSLHSLDFNVSMGSYALKNELLNFTLILSDPERNPIEVMIDFGDNSSRLYFNLTDFVDNNVTIAFSHSYANLGDYLIQIFYSDNKVGLGEHSKVRNVTIKVDEPPVVVKTSWSWWDYTSLGLVCMMPVLVVLRFIQMARRRRSIEDMGMTYDEWKLLKSVRDEELPKEKEGGP